MPVGGEGDGNESGDGDDGGEEGGNNGGVDMGGVDGGRCMLKAEMGVREGGKGAGVSTVSWYA